MKASLNSVSYERGISPGFAPRVIDTLSAFIGVLALDGTLIEIHCPPPNGDNIVSDDVLGKPFAEGYWWSYSPLIQDQMRDAIARARNGDAVRFDVDVRVSKTEMVPVDFRILPLRNDSGIVTHLVASAIVITQRKLVEAELRQSESRLRKFFESDLIGVCFLDRFGAFSDGNDEFLRVVGYTRQDLQNGLVRLDRMTPPEYYEVDVGRLAEAAARGSCTQYEKEYIRKDGGRVAICCGYTLLNGTQDEYIGFIMDISARKKAEESLRETEKWFRAVAESLPQLVWVANAAGERTYFNKRFIDYTGISKNELTSKSWLDFVHPDDLAGKVEKWRQCVKSGERYENEYRLRGHDGLYRHFLSRAVPVHDDDGQIKHWLGSSTDIHDQKLAEEALRRSEKLATAGRLAASMAHEINNPLAAVTNLIYLTLQDQSLSLVAREQLGMADQELARVAQIVKQSLRFHKQSSWAAPADPAVVMESVLTLFARRLDQSAIVVERSFRSTPSLYCFSDELRQAFAALIGNSLDATSKGGRIFIRIRTGNSWTGNGEAGIRVTIADTGTGIQPGVKGHIFEPFISTKDDTGTGLGLWVTEGIIRKHLGRIAFRSIATPARHGTVFSLFLPYSGLCPKDNPS